MSETKNCQNCKNDFIIEPDDFSFYEKMKVPPPTWCPSCRYKRRIIWRNERHLFRGKESVENKEIFMGISPDVGIPIYELSYWNSDKWDPMDYGVDYDFTKPFFEQIRDLFRLVPYPAKSMQRCVDSEYSNQCDDMKNTYLCFNAVNLEDSAYCCNASNSRKCFDMTSCYDDELCYENVRVDKSYHTIGSVMSENCVDVWFSKNCVGCSNCFGCVNQRNSSYKIFNEQFTKEDYFEKIKSFNLGTSTGFLNSQKNAEDFWKKFPIKYMLGFRNYDVTGEDIKDSKNVKQSYIVQGGENLKYVQDVPFGGASNSYDYTCWGVNASQLYECMICGENVDQVKFCFDCWPNCQELEYCINSRRSKNCFGCVGIKDKQYCIFNKQYTKEAYFKTVNHIKKQMNEIPFTDKLRRIYKYGEFFPSEFSPFAYNETILNDQFPSNKESAEGLGFMWRDSNKKEYETTVSATELPDSILQSDVGVTKELIKCSECSKAFRIINDEFNFLKSQDLPLPRFCSNCRFMRRQRFMVPPVLNESQCMCNGTAEINSNYKNSQKHQSHDIEQCSTSFETAYSPKDNIIYCEKCYQQEVI